jgi:hypothetical protein
MKFAFLGYGVEQNWDAMSKSELDAMLEECFAYDGDLLQRGFLLEDGAALQPSRTAKTLRWHDGAAVVTDGPYAETKEQLGGLGVLEARDMTHAVDVMSKHPGLRYGTTFEIRPIDEEVLQRLQTSIAKWRAGVPVNENAVQFAAIGYNCEGGKNALPAGDFETLMQRCAAFDEMRIKNGQWLTGIKLGSARLAKTLRYDGGSVVVTDGPYAETKEALGGVVVLAVKDQNEAVALLSAHPALAFGVVMELRPINEAVSKAWAALKSHAASA